jgi:hypothetical protein
MKRIVKLVQATDQEIETRKEELQVMWEDRWLLLGTSGRNAWIQRHGDQPAFICPLLKAPRHAVRFLVTGGRATRFARLLRRIRMAL